MIFDIYLPLPSGEGEFKLCSCDSPEAVAEIVRVLCAKGTAGPQQLTVKVRYS